jgi:sugar-specific transcriptional regulator TrmB
MDVDEAVASLERLGLTEYEARVFIALQQLGSGTAREVHRVADVPRSQVYSAAEGLEEHGLVEVQQSSPMRYRPVSIEEARSTLTERFEREQERAFEYVESVRSEEPPGEQQEDIWTVGGRDKVESRSAELIHEAEEWVLYGTSHPEHVTDDVTAALRDRADAGLAVGVVSENPAVRESVTDNPGIHVREPSHPHGDDASGRVLFADDEVLLLSVVAGEELPGIDRETAFWSAHTNFASALISLIQAREQGFEP